MGRQLDRVPLYASDGALLEHVPVAYVLLLEDRQMARLVRHQKGYVNRAYLHPRPGDPPPITLQQYGTRYSYREHLESGHLCWRFRKLTERGDFLQPLRDPAEVRRESDGV